MTQKELLDSAARLNQKIKEAKAGKPAVAPKVKAKAKKKADAK